MVAVILLLPLLLFFPLPFLLPLLLPFPFLLPLLFSFFFFLLFLLRLPLLLLFLLFLPSSLLLSFLSSCFLSFVYVIPRTVFLDSIHIHKHRKNRIKCICTEDKVFYSDLSFGEKEINVEHGFTNRVVVRSKTQRENGVFNKRKVC